MARLTGAKPLRPASLELLAYSGRCMNRDWPLLRRTASIASLPHTWSSFPSKTPCVTKPATDYCSHNKGSSLSSSRWTPPRFSEKAVLGKAVFGGPRRSRLFSTGLRCHQQDDHSSPVPSKKPRGNLLAATAHENIYTLPNMLTFTRLLAGPGLAYLVLHDQHLAAFALFTYAGLTDLLDGWIARRWNQQTVVGSVIDPMADKTLMTATTLALAAQARLPWPLAVIILGRDVLLGAAAIYYRWISLPPPKTMTRYWDFSLPSAEVRPTGISKVNTALQLGLIGATVAMPLVPESIVAAWGLGKGLWGFQWAVGVTTVWSGLSYVGSKDAVRILNTETQGKTEDGERRSGE